MQDATSVTLAVAGRRSGWSGLFGALTSREALGSWFPCDVVTDSDCVSCLPGRLAGPRG